MNGLSKILILAATSFLVSCNTAKITGNNYNTVPSSSPNVTQNVGENNFSSAEKQAPNLPGDIFPNERIAQIYDLSEFDLENDGILEISDVIKPGDIIFRPSDGITQVEEGYYIVPNNIVYVDSNADNTLDNGPVYASLVVVRRDNLTYLFDPLTQRVKGVFPNSTGQGGINTSVSVRQIMEILDASWGLMTSIQKGDAPYPDGSPINYFGDFTLALDYYISKNRTVNTEQELHGTFRAHAGSVDGYTLLGIDSSGGCTRHTNEAIRKIVENVSIGDYVIFVETPEDDIIDNPLTIYNRTRKAANLQNAEVPFIEGDISFLDKPSNYQPTQINLEKITTSTWVDFGQLHWPSTYLPIESPILWENTESWPSGMEAFFLGMRLTGHQLLIEENNQYRLNLPSTLFSTEDNEINLDEFYKPRTVSLEEIEKKRYNLSGGDPLIGVFEYLMEDFITQYSRYVLEKSDQTLLLAKWQRREIQLDTGFLPSSHFLEKPDNSLFVNPSLPHRLMNLFYGRPGEVYELNSSTDEAIPLEDILTSEPIKDYAMARIKNSERQPIQNLIEEAVTSNRAVIFLVPAWQWDYPNYLLRMPTNQYFVLIPEFTDFSRGYIAVEDTTSPYDLLLVPLNEIPYLFRTVTISPSQ